MTEDSKKASPQPLHGPAWAEEHAPAQPHHRHLLLVGGHLSVEELWTKVREQDTKVSVATVYRTMKLLTDMRAGPRAQLRRRADALRGRRRPAPPRPPHLHPLRDDRRVRERPHRGAPGRGGAASTASSSPRTRWSSTGCARNCQRDRDRADSRAHEVLAPRPGVRVLLALGLRAGAGAPEPVEASGRRASSSIALPVAGAGARPRCSRDRWCWCTSSPRWCFPCLAELPTLTSAAARLRAGGFQVVAVGMDLEGGQVLGPFADALRAPLPGAAGGRRASAQGQSAFGPITALPTAFLLVPGRRVAAWQGVAGQPEPGEGLELAEQADCSGAARECYRAGAVFLPGPGPLVPSAGS